MTDSTLLYAIAASATVAAITAAYFYFARGGQQNKSAAATTPTAAASSSPSSSAGNDDAVIVPQEYRPFRLVFRETLIPRPARNGESEAAAAAAAAEGNVVPVVLFRFALPGGAQQKLNLPLGQHISIRATVPALPGAAEPTEVIKRSYTPSKPSVDCIGHFDLIVKLYPQGRMSQYLSQLQVGQSIDIAGPKGTFLYRDGQYKHIGMIAGGSGITPMLQLMEYVLNHESDTRISLLYGNLSEDDIIYKDEMDQWTAIHGPAGTNRFHVYHVLNNPPPHTVPHKYGSGFINKDLIQQHLVDRALACGAGKSPNDSIVLMCGPPPMIKAMSGILQGEPFNMGRGTYHTF